MLTSFYPNLRYLPTLQTHTLLPSINFPSTIVATAITHPPPQNAYNLPFIRYFKYHPINRLQRALHLHLIAPGITSRFYDANIRHNLCITKLPAVVKLHKD